MKEEVSDLIDYWATKLDLYDNRFPDEEQCGGYHAFRRMCLREQGLPKGPFKDRNGAIWVEDPDLNHLHVLIREAAVDSARYVRKKLKKSKL